MSILVAVRQWFQPYYRPKPKAAKRTKCVIEEVPEKSVSVNGDPAIKIPVKSTTIPLTNPMHFTTRPQNDTIWCYRDTNVCQVFAHFNAGKDAGNKFPERDDDARKKLKCTIYPTDRRFDRAHLIPIGYHGSESDPRLLVGWDSNQNQQQQRAFEIRVKEYNRNHEIYWFTQISKIKGGLRWSYRIYDGKTDRLVAKADMDMLGQYVWK